MVDRATHDLFPRKDYLAESGGRRKTGVQQMLAIRPGMIGAFETGAVSGLRMNVIGSRHKAKLHVTLMMKGFVGPQC